MGRGHHTSLRGLGFEFHQKCWLGIALRCVQHEHCRYVMLDDVVAGARCGGSGAEVQDRPAQLRGLHPGSQDAQGEHQGTLPETRPGRHCE